jgi:hypothetical protein
LVCDSEGKVSKIGPKFVQSKEQKVGRVTKWTALGAFLKSEDHQLHLGGKARLKTANTERFSNKNRKI